MLNKEKQIDPTGEQLAAMLQKGYPRDKLKNLLDDGATYRHLNVILNNRDNFRLPSKGQIKLLNKYTIKHNKDTTKAEANTMIRRFERQNKVIMSQKKAAKINKSWQLKKNQTRVGRVTSPPDLGTNPRRSASPTSRIPNPLEDGSNGAPLG